MSTATGGPTLLHPDHAHRAATSPPGSQGAATRSGSADATTPSHDGALVRRRFFLAGLFPSLTTESDRAILLGAIVQWLPAALSIVVALFVAAAITNPRLASRAAAAIAVVFQIASSYGIAAAELLQPQSLDLGNTTWIGLSWVAVWTLIFNIVVPSSPRRSVLAALAASTSVPVMAALSIAAHAPPRVFSKREFFFVFVFPYLLVVAMAYVGARVMFALGNEVRKARELGSYRLLERLGQGGIWARCGAHAIGCWRGRPRSSSFVRWPRRRQSTDPKPRPGSSARRRRSRACAHRTPWTSSTSASLTTGRFTM